MKLLLLAFLATSVYAQVTGGLGAYDPTLPRWQFIAASTKVTVQSSSTADPVYFETVDIQCAADSTITFSWNGTAASTTAGTLKKLPSFFPAMAPPDVFTASNVGAGTTGKTFPVTGSTTVLGGNYDISMFMLGGRSGGGTNFTIASTNSCTFQITFRQQIK